MRSEKQFQKAVQKGAALLDKKKPGWVDEFIKNGKKHGFDLSEAQICVLGNAFRNGMSESGYIRGLAELGLGNPDEEEAADKRSAAHGFCVTQEESYDFEDTDMAWQALSHYWQVEILKRTCAKKPGLIEAVLGIFRNQGSDDD